MNGITPPRPKGAQAEIMRLTKEQRRDNLRYWAAKAKYYDGLNQSTAAWYCHHAAADFAETLGLHYRRPGGLAPERELERI